MTSHCPIEAVILALLPGHHPPLPSRLSWGTVFRKRGFLDSGAWQTRACPLPGDSVTGEGELGAAEAMGARSRPWLHSAYGRQGLSPLF